MTPVRRVVALLLLFAVMSSSVEVLFGDRHAVDDLAAEQAVAVQEAPSGAGMTLNAASSESERSTEDCPCLCACACAGAQLVVPPVGAVIDLTTLGFDLSLVEPLRLIPLPARRPPFRPPLA